ncbi:hypothetical protein COV49_03680 [Candidatus Falkowbacteria bacterium CG11_big_fil_rev_8_21_14_0_20_39_10]|uniref:Methyltransferase type 11 domain-containing protein n=1 Tax=Candidatus Falkowbacteria bacterium CG11_big_fil_rev_8_21_14_0_20_39_10 TaxID=1974570 RepID=A0A2M6K899_9BACT|nr:MAG: hypothetical protein COV49_03680 [Candidatus Falkowbacteria bacterium CG11_big_fil_rev_8_21_14_0_20_39_10]
MILTKDFLDILCCPNRSCRGDLIEIEKNGKNMLYCQSCNADYPIIQGIPVLFPNSEYSPQIHERHWDLSNNAHSYAKKYNSYLKKQGQPWGLYTHESELKAINKLTKNVDFKGKTIMDCGSGNGRLLSSYSEAKRKIGIDTSLALLLDNKIREPDFWLVCGQLEDMPFKDCISDFSISIRVYQHLRSPEDAFAEMVRITKPDGYVSLELYNKLNLKELYKRFRMLKFMNKKWPWGLDYDRYYSYREIEKWCEDNFVKPIKYSGAGWGIHFYLFELIQFRRFAPQFLQKIVYSLFLRFEDVVGMWPFFSKTLEKVCFIGSIQSGEKKVSRIDRLKRKIKRQKELRDAKKFENLLMDRNYALVGSNFKHLSLGVDWIKKAQDATADSGVSRGYSLVDNGKNNSSGWQPSYPETTGYIIPTIVRAGKVLNDEDLLRRARLMADWEMSIMHSDGAVNGGNISVKPNKSVFDTGQVIRGLIAIYEETKDNKYLEAAIKSSEWILKNEYNMEGRWIDNNASCVNANTTTYNVYAIAPIVKLGVIANNNSFIELGRRVADTTIKAQNKNFWFKDADFIKSKDALLHTIAYTIDGLWDVGELLEEEEILKKAKKSLDCVLSKTDEKGRIPGRLSGNWRPTVDWICLTGVAQIGVTAMKIYNKTGEKKYLIKAEKIKEFLKTCQNNLDENFGGKGAVWGSWPISGEYGKYEALNWPVKYFIDLLLGFIDKKNDE